jgi:flagellar motor switch protein FliG
MCYCYALELAQRVLPRLFPKSKEADFAWELIQKIRSQALLENPWELIQKICSQVFLENPW